MGLGLGLIPLVVVGQTALSTMMFGDQKTISINTGSCGGTITVSWTLTMRAVHCSNLFMWVTDQSSCGDAAAATDLALPDVDTSMLALSMPYGPTPVDIAVDSLPYFANMTADGGSGCGITGVD